MSLRAWPNRIPLAIGAVAAVVCAAACDASAPVPAPGAAPRQVTVVGEGHVEGTPDTLTAAVSIASRAADATSALNQSSTRQRAVVDALTGLGVAAKDVATRQVSLQPQYGTSQQIVGYEATNALDVKLRQVDLASRALGAIVTAGGDDTRIDSVGFAIDDDSKLVHDARDRAFADAKDRAAQYAKLSGATLGEVLSISEAAASPTPPVPGPLPRMAIADAVPLSPGTQRVGFSVTVVFGLR